MRHFLFAAVIGFFAATASADVTFEPAPPTSHSFVMLRQRGHWRDTCVPTRTGITRVERTVDVRWTIGDCVGLGFTTPWWDDVPLGVFDPGVYTVRLSVDDQLVETHALVVTSGAPPFGVTPPYASTRDSKSVFLFEPEGCELAFRDATVLIDGAEVRSSSAGCIVVATAAPHPLGAVDVTVRTASDTTLTAPVALRYLDPAAPVDPSVFERILLPILYNGPGAFGSEWRTEAKVESLTLGFDWFHDFERAAVAGECSHALPCFDFHDHPGGLVVSVPRQGADRISFSLRIRDVSRSEDSWGVEIPVVRERDQRYELVFPDVPFDSRHRLMLRLYSVRGVTRVWHVATGTGVNVVRRSVQLTGPCAEPPCASARPSFAAVDLNQLFPELAGQGRQRLFVESSADEKWGFITVTNNTTQEVTVISPMH